MFTEKKLSEIKAQLRAAFATLPGGPHAYFDHKIADAKVNGTRDVRTLEMLRAVLDSDEPRVPKKRKKKGK